jgi:AcrR family transcriptional regulator
VAAILTAARELFGKCGYARVTTNHIAARAGVSIGSLYQYFPNKEAILLRLVEDHLHEVENQIEMALTEFADPAVRFTTALENLFSRSLAFHEEDPDFHRMLGTEFDLPPALQGAHHRRGQYAERVALILRERPDVDCRDYNITAHIISQTLEALSRWLVHNAPADLDRERFIREAVTMVAGYVTRR